MEEQKTGKHGSVEKWLSPVSGASAPKHGKISPTRLDLTEAENLTMRMPSASVTPQMQVNVDPFMA